MIIFDLEQIPHITYLGLNMRTPNLDTRAVVAVWSWARSRGSILSGLNGIT